MVTRREFLDAIAMGAAGLAVGTTARSYAQILGSNDRLNFAVIGLNGRGYAHLASLKANQQLGPHLARLRCGQQYSEEVRGRHATRNGRSPGHRERLSQDSGAERCGRDHHCHARPLARADGASRGCRRASTSTWKSHAATIRPKERCWCRRSRNTGSSCRWARSSARHRTPSRSSTRFTTGADRQALLRQGLVQQCTQVDRHWQRSASSRRNSIGTSGKALRRAGRTRTTCSRTTGTGSEFTAPAKP